MAQYHSGGNTPFPFGRYKGTPVKDLPCDYLEWLRENVEFFPYFAGVMEQVWGGSFRRQSNRKHEQQQRTNGTRATTPGPDYKALRRKFATQLHPDRPGGSKKGMSACNQIFDHLESLE